jgi:hypothetical protein
MPINKGTNRWFWWLVATFVVCMALLLEARICACKSICYCMVNVYVLQWDNFSASQARANFCDFLNLENLCPRHELSRRTRPTEAAEGRISREELT